MTLKTTENQRFFWRFQELWKWSIGVKWVKSRRSYSSVLNVYAQEILKSSKNHRTGETVIRRR